MLIPLTEQLCVTHHPTPSQCFWMAWKPSLLPAVRKRRRWESASSLLTTTGMLNWLREQADESAIQRFLQLSHPCQAC